MKSTKNIDFGLLILRIVTGGLMLPHGIAKLFKGFDAVKNMLQAKGLPEFLWLGVPLTEVLAPILLILGVFTRVSGLMILIVMVFAIYLTIGMGAFQAGKSGGLTGELNFLFMINGLFLFLVGPGKYALGKSRKFWAQ